MKRSLQIDAAPVLGHLETLISFGAPRALLEKALGATKEALAVVDARVPFIQNVHMIAKGIEFLGADIPLRMGTAVSLERLGVCGYLFLNCQNLQEVSDQFVRYQKLLYAVSDFTIKNGKTTCHIEHSIRMPAYAYYEPILVELAFSSVLTILRQLVGPAVMPVRLDLRFSKPEHVAAYRHLFRSTLTFNQTSNRMVFPKSLMATPISRSQPYVKHILERHADSLLAELDGWGGFKNEVASVAMALLPTSRLTIEQVSKQLNMSRWTLTRKLKHHGLTYKGLIRGLKEEIALNYLANERLSITDIAFLLGYSEVSAFRRAFKGWTGKTPREYRQAG